MTFDTTRLHNAIKPYLFVHDDLLTSYRFTTGTEQLTKCCEPLQKLRVKLGIGSARILHNS